MMACDEANAMQKRGMRQLFVLREPRCAAELVQRVFCIASTAYPALLQQPTCCAKERSIGDRRQ